MKFAKTVFAARQLISHCHVLVNGKQVNIASYLVNEGDEISIREKSKSNTVILEAIESSERDFPTYMEVDAKALKGKFVNTPKLEDVPYPVMMEPNIVIEYYSR